MTPSRIPSYRPEDAPENEDLLFEINCEGVPGLVRQGYRTGSLLYIGGDRYETHEINSWAPLPQLLPPGAAVPDVDRLKAERDLWRALARAQHTTKVINIVRSMGLFEYAKELEESNELGGGFLPLKAAFLAAYGSLPEGME